jgi:hypothetical protein
MVSTSLGYFVQRHLHRVTQGDSAPLPQPLVTRISQLRNPELNTQCVPHEALSSSPSTLKKIN